ncbi:Kinesin light chain 6 [Stagonosporopsis vannaccii]|nr:Kinesin light chain 6 [Stagonosporopsis vannaccii]
MAPRLRCGDYTVGWVCALPVELAAAQEMLDEEHDTPHYNLHDTNLYTCGRIGEHNVVIACLPEGQTGTSSAAAVAVQMKSTFSATRFGLMVGIGGGVPGQSEDADVRLGDVVVSKPFGTHGGVVQYDFGKATTSGFERTGALNTPPTVLLNAVANLRAKHMRGRGRLLEFLSKLDSLPHFTREAAGSDVLYNGDCEQEVSRPARRQAVMVHHGTIASGNRVIKNAAIRDKLSAELGGVLCFEMEAAGLMNNFPCLVVRGICDYADSHKNKRWQSYAAGTAAAYAKEVLSVIPPTEVARSRTAEQTMRDASVKPTYCIPFLKNRHFVGRHDELARLRQRFIVDKDCQKMTILGLGGTGKTQIALQLAYTVQEAEPERSIFWMPAVSIESFEKACMDIAVALGIPSATIKEEDPKELVKQRLSSSSAGPWLLIVDNADDTDIFFGVGQQKGIVDFLPQSESGMVVYTTRTPEMAELTPGDVLEIGAMSQRDARDFFARSLTRKDLLRNDKKSDQLMDELLGELTCLPLAIAQAAAYLNRNRMPIFKYLHLLRNTEQDLVSLMSKEFRDDTRYSGSANAVATTWVVSFTQIRKNDETAATLLQFMSCIEWKAIPRSLLPSVQSEVEMEDAIGTLCGYSFLVRREDTGGAAGEEPDGTIQASHKEVFDIHRLVHLATRIWINTYGDPTHVIGAAIQSIEAIFPDNDHANQHIWRAYMPHALRLLKAGQDCDVEEKSSLYLWVGRCLDADGRTREAVTWLEESCRLRSTLKEDDPALLSSQHSLAKAYDGNGQTKKAIELLEVVVDVRAKVLSAGHPNQLASQHVLAGAYQADGQIERAVELLETVVKAEETLEAEDPSRLASQHALARAYQANGQGSKAIELLESVCKIRSRMLKADHPSLLAAQHSLAVVYYEGGEIKKALELLESVVEIRTRVLRADHNSLLASQHALACAYFTDGHVQRGVELMESVVEVKTCVLRADHPSLLISQHGLSQAYFADGQFSKAMALLEHVAKFYARILRADHPDRLMAQHDLALAYHADGLQEKAIELMENVVELGARALRVDHPSQLRSVKALAEMRAGLAASSNETSTRASPESPMISTAESDSTLPNATTEDEHAVWERLRQAMIL